jgi:hypothetical protein
MSIRYIYLRRASCYGMTQNSVLTTLYLRRDNSSLAARSFEICCLC